MTFFHRNDILYLNMNFEVVEMAEKKNISLQFRGSENQRILDMKKTLAAHEPVLWEKCRR